MLACAIIGMYKAPREGRRSIPPTHLSLHLVMDILICGTCLFGCACMISLDSMLLLFKLGSFHCLQKISWEAHARNIGT